MAFDLLWALGIELSPDGPPLVPALILDHDDHIKRAPLSFLAATESPPLAWHAQRGLIETKHRRFSTSALAQARALPAPGRLLRRSLGFIGVTDQHVIYEMQTDAGTLWIPALTLISALFGSTRFLAERLLLHGSVNRLIRPGTRSRSGTINLELGESPWGGRISNECVRTIAWLATDRGARHSFDSVYHYAWSQGRIAFDLPDCLIDGWAWGIEDRDGLLVTNIRGLRVTFPGAISDIRVRVGSIQMLVAGRGAEDEVFSFGTRTPERTNPAKFSIESYLGG